MNVVHTLKLNRKGQLCFLGLGTTDLDAQSPRLSLEEAGIKPFSSTFQLAVFEFCRSAVTAILAMEKQEPSISERHKNVSLSTARLISDIVKFTDYFARVLSSFPGEKPCRAGNKAYKQQADRIDALYGAHAYVLRQCRNALEHELCERRIGEIISPEPGYEFQIGYLRDNAHDVMRENPHVSKRDIWPIDGVIYPDLIALWSLDRICRTAEYLAVELGITSTEQCVIGFLSEDDLALFIKWIERHSTAVVLGPKEPRMSLSSAVDERDGSLFLMITEHPKILT